jgi:Transposase IS66 family
MLVPKLDVEGLSAAELRRLVGELLGEVARLREENAALRDELARQKGLKGRPKIKPSGMERATATQAKKPKRKPKGSSANTTKRVVEEEQVLAIDAPAGSRFKGYEDFVVQDLRLEPRQIRYRRQRWLTPDGRTLLAPLPTGLAGHFGPELHRFVLLQHHQGQVTTERITAFLNSLGVAISKRQIVRLLTTKSTALVDQAKAVLRAGLDTAAWITVDDTGARHRARNGVTTQIGDDRFTFFATSFSKSRRNFLEILRAGHDDYVLDDPAFAYMHDHDLAGSVIDQLVAHPTKHLPGEAAWLAHLDGLGITQLRVNPNPVKIATEGALLGSIRHHGLLQNTVIVSDDAGQFRIGSHALCWIHAERLVHKLIPFNDRQRLAIELVRQLIWWFYADLRVYQRDPCRRRRAQLRTRFDRIFRRRTGFVTLDRLLARLHARKDELLLVLDRPEIPLHTNGSENDIRCHVTKRKVSGGTWSETGRNARDACLGLMKTCQKLGLSFFDYLGARLGVPDAPLFAPLPELVRARAVT